MGVLMIVSMRGPTRELVAASDLLEERLGMPDGLLARVVAPSEDGIILVNLWASEELRLASNDDPAHADVVRGSGLADLAQETVAQRYETSRFTLAAH
jgi:hypothetical protein